MQHPKYMYKCRWWILRELNLVEDRTPQGYKRRHEPGHRCPLCGYSTTDPMVFDHTGILPIPIPLRMLCLKYIFEELEHA